MAITAKPINQVRESLPVHLVTRDDMVRVNILVPARIRQEWKVAVAKEGRTVTDVLIALMNDHVARIK
jgi:hypothetical protein